MQKFCNALADAPATLLYVADSAMYGNAVKQGKELLLLSRVPENIKMSQELFYQMDVAWVQL